jgi:NAD(P)H dehydrogenase (quinone)
MKIAVTAASGQLGGLIVNGLVKQIGTSNVVALARTPEIAQGLGVEVRLGDYNHITNLERSLIGVDTVLLVSGMDVPDKRIEQHRNVINAAKNSGVKKIVYTSVQGAEHDTAFSPVIQSNRQTEEDIKSSGLDWVIGRNGIYIEPDIKYIESYKKAGNVSNCASQGYCAYTNRNELAFAYVKMLLEDKHQGHTYNLHGELLTQKQLVDYLNQTYGLSLRFIALTYEEYKADRVAELGDFIGNVIAGIYQGIAQGAFENESHYAQAAGRPHQTWQDYFAGLN